MIGAITFFAVYCMFGLLGRTVPEKFDDIFGEILGQEVIFDFLALFLSGLIGDAIKPEARFYVVLVAIFAPFIISVFITFKNADEKGEVEDD